jgi:integral membrane sensor domain MASE1
MLAGGLRPLLLGQSSCFCLAVHLLELKALIAVAVTLGIAEVVAGRGPAGLFGGLFWGGLTPVGCGAHTLAEMLALHAEFFTATGQDVLTGGPGTLGP